MYSFRKIKRNNSTIFQRIIKSFVININRWVQQSKRKINRYATKKTKNTPVKSKTGAALIISSKMFNKNDPPHELLLTTRHKTKLRNAFNNNM